MRYAVEVHIKVTLFLSQLYGKFVPEIPTSSDEIPLSDDLDYRGK